MIRFHPARLKINFPCSTCGIEGLYLEALSKYIVERYARQPAVVKSEVAHLRNNIRPEAETAPGSRDYGGIFTYLQVSLSSLGKLRMIPTDLG